MRPDGTHAPRSRHARELRRQRNAERREREMDLSPLCRAMDEITALYYPDGVPEGTHVRTDEDFESVFGVHPRDVKPPRPTSIKLLQYKDVGPRLTFPYRFPEAR